MARRSAALAKAHEAAERLVEQSRATIQTEAEAAREKLGREAREIARGVAASILQRPS
jgi:F0F1-type ATP synthase membrane subunit b/b'